MTGKTKRPPTGPFHAILKRLPVPGTPAPVAPVTAMAPAARTPAAVAPKAVVAPAAAAAPAAAPAAAVPNFYRIAGHLALQPRRGGGYRGGLRGQAKKRAGSYCNGKHILLHEQIL